MNVKQSSADNVWKLICHLIFPKILKYSRKNRYTVYYSITIFDFLSLCISCILL